MNNNRNNRRRGRNSRSQGGPNQGNRIDSRARGNAPQLLDKYKKLAQDAQHNGDRVQMEYYLQFADHYFRVIADNKARQDEQRTKRQDERGDSRDDEDDDYEDGREERQPRQRRNNRRDRDEGGQDQDNASDDGGEDSSYEPEENPFIRDNSPREEKRPARKPRANPRRKVAAEDSEGIDASILPPAIGGDADADEAPAKPAPRRRRKPAASEGDETLSVAG
ncbi:MAG: DUF4167 domain-containing protein [Sphingomonadaceae bacterium]|nr:DUF4167 domain-containing protein [Sphingomonadaceae bacterium]